MPLGRTVGTRTRHQPVTRHHGQHIHGVIIVMATRSHRRLRESPQTVLVVTMEPRTNGIQLIAFSRLQLMVPILITVVIV